jgi:succinate dehydrogenase flavoprotein subunit
VKAGRGTEAGGVFLDIASRRPADFILKRLPSMYHQFKELADVDITKQPMEIGPTCHYVMGGVEVDADSQATPAVPGLYAAGEVSGGMHGSNRLGGNSLSDLLVFGKRAGEYAARYVDELGENRPQVSKSDVEAATANALAPLNRSEGENPYDLWHELQTVMQDLVGIIRRKHELEDSIKRLAELKPRIEGVAAIGGRKYNPGWHLALDLRNMIIVSESTAKAALLREESRGGHTREDFPDMDPKWRQINLVCGLDGEDVRINEQPVPTMRDDLLLLFDVKEMSKYMTEDELAVFLTEKGGK